MTADDSRPRFPAIAAARRTIGLVAARPDFLRRDAKKLGDQCLHIRGRLDQGRANGGSCVTIGKGKIFKGHAAFADGRLDVFLVPVLLSRHGNPRHPAEAGFFGVSELAFVVTNVAAYLSKVKIEMAFKLTNLTCLGERQ